MVARTADQEQSLARQLLTVAEVAALLHVSRWFVYDHGVELGLVKIGGANRYRLEAVEEYIAARVAAASSQPRPAPRPTARVGRPRRRSRRIPLLETGR